MRLSGYDHRISLIRCVFYNLIPSPLFVWVFSMADSVHTTIYIYVYVYIGLYNYNCIQYTVYTVPCYHTKLVVPSIARGT